MGRADRQGDHAAALAAARAVPAGSPLARRARFLAGVSLLDLKRYDEAFDAFKALVDVAPVPPRRNRHGRRGLQQPRRRRSIRRGATPQTGTATFYLTKAADADAGDADYLFNLGYAYVLDRNYQGAIYWLREALRRNPADADAHYVLAAALEAAGSTVEADARKGAGAAAVVALRGPRAPRRRRQAARPAWPRARPDRSRAAERHRVPSRRSSTPRSASSASLPRSISIGDGGCTSARRTARRWWSCGARSTCRRTRRRRTCSSAGFISARGVRREAVDALRSRSGAQDTAAARIALAEAYLKLQNAAAARAELERALALDPASSEAKRILSTISRWELRLRVTRKPQTGRPDDSHRVGVIRGVRLRVPTASCLHARSPLRRARHGSGARRRRTRRRRASAPVVYTAEIDGIIHPVVAEYMREAIAQPTPPAPRSSSSRCARRAACVDSTRDINNAIIRAEDAGRGFRRAVGEPRRVGRLPDHHRGRRRRDGPGHAHRRRASGRGQRREDRRDDGEEDGVGRRGLRAGPWQRSGSATSRWSSRPSREPVVHRAGSARRNAAAHRSRSRTTFPICVQKLDGRTITRFDGRTETLHTGRRATICVVEMTWQQRVLSAIAHPQIAYLLLTLGTLGLTDRAVEPGRHPARRRRRHLPAARVFRVPGAAGELRRRAADAVRSALLVLEVKVTSFGLLAVGGIVSLFFGSMMLIDSPLPELQIGLRLIVPVTLGIAGVLLFLVRWRVQAQRTPAGHRTLGMLDELAQALTAIEPGGRAACARTARSGPRRPMTRSKQAARAVTGMAGCSCRPHSTAQSGAVHRRKRNARRGLPLTADVRLNVSHG